MLENTNRHRLSPKKLIAFIAILCFTSVPNAQEALKEVNYAVILQNQQFDCQFTDIIIDNDAEGFPYMHVNFTDELKSVGVTDKKSCELDFFVLILPTKNNIRLKSLQFSVKGNYLVKSSSIAAARVRLRYNNSSLSQSEQLIVIAPENEIREESFDLDVTLATKHPPSDSPDEDDCGKPVSIEASIYSEFQYAPDSPGFIQINEAFVDHSRMTFEECDPTPPLQS
ncbi:hypothetical protein P3339_13685 [Microbulbifer sp. MLAF003]|uniref:hypothetical protein n=1 Tax=unclassified Microbulbifer TaxID=2619833 RepID=UPI0024AC91A2|nr:hypothetical protein [Microbulbifer sp. MLAF003]WHI49521.1 hypothetical protein P3339_13685 [Microbulbifer sp. MLAF003]